ncbi:hypothetical protein Hanom_Chr16g01484171 [Helianthus anomalus]
MVMKITYYAVEDNEYVDVVFRFWSLLEFFVTPLPILLFRQPLWEMCTVYWWNYLLFIMIEVRERERELKRVGSPQKSLLELPVKPRVVMGLEREGEGDWSERVGR